MFAFKITAQDGEARVGELETPHGTVTTPCFMPVGTHGAVKGVSPEELTNTGSQIVLANTYHLYLRPGSDRIERLGGLHTFTGWNGPMLTDSGGFQVFSLGERGINGVSKTPLRKVTEEGVAFQSHLDGSKHLITPEKSISIQQELGADIIMAFDQPVYGMASKEMAREAMLRSKFWLKRCITQWKAGDIEKQALFGIVQGGIHTELHRDSAQFVADLDLPGNAIGGLSVGEDKAVMWQAVESINSILPAAKPRYFMGLGHPRDLIEASIRGVDMYDCVAPSRLGRHGVVWMPVGEGREAFWSGDTESFLASEGVTIERWNFHNARFAEDQSTLPGQWPTFATLHHYAKEGEMLGHRYMTIHNITLLHRITEHLRSAIRLRRVNDLSEILL
jgi:queuine tRNA-ribosyltransferase